MSTNLRWSRPEPPAVQTHRSRRPVFWAVLSVIAVLSVTLLVALVLNDRDDDSTSDDRSATPPTMSFLVGPGFAGPFTIGDNGQDLADEGFVTADPDLNCGQAWAPFEDTSVTGFFLSFRLGGDDDLDQVFIKDPDAGGHSDWQTDEGAGIGTTLGELKRLYGDRLQHHRWPMVDGGFASDTWTMFGPDGALTFDFGRIVRNDKAQVVALEVTGARDLAHLQPPDLGC